MYVTLNVIWLKKYVDDGEEEEEPQKDEEDEEDDDDIEPSVSWTDRIRNVLPVQQPASKWSSSFKNPRNVPSDSCPRDEDLAQTQVNLNLFNKIIIIINLRKLI